MSEELNGAVEAANDTPLADPTETEVDREVDTEQQLPENVDDVSAEGEGEAQETPSDEEAELEAAMAEIEFEGQTYEVPEVLKSGFMMDRDYRQKTQALAEQNRQIAEQQKTIESNLNTSEEIISLRGQMHSIDQQIAQYENVNWQEFNQNDPVSAQEHFMNLQQLKDTKSALGSDLEKKQTEVSEQMERDTANRIEETLKFAQTEIPNWSPDLDNQITSFATQELGVSREQLIEVLSPAVYRALHLARLGHQSIQRAKTAKPQPSRPKAKPLKQVDGAGSNMDGPVEEIDDMEAYANKRRKQMGMP